MRMASRTRIGLHLQVSRGHTCLQRIYHCPVSSPRPLIHREGPVYERAVVVSGVPWTAWVSHESYEIGLPGQVAAGSTVRAAAYITLTDGGLAKAEIQAPTTAQAVEVLGRLLTKLSSPMARRAV